MTQQAFVIYPADGPGQRMTVIGPYVDRAVAKAAAIPNGHVVANEVDVIWTGPVLVEVYNAVAGARIKKFESRDIGGKRLLSVLPTIAKPVANGVSSDGAPSRVPIREKEIEMTDEAQTDEKAVKKQEREAYKALKLQAAAAAKAEREAAKAAKKQEAETAADAKAAKAADRQAKRDAKLKAKEDAAAVKEAKAADRERKLQEAEAAKAAKKAEREAARAAKPQKASTGEPRNGKNAQRDSLAASGVVPEKPIVTSPTNLHRQKHFDKLADLAAAGDWDGVAAFAMHGIDSYSKDINRYRDRLLAAHNATNAQAAE